MSVSGRVGEWGVCECHSLRGARTSWRKSLPRRSLRPGDEVEGDKISDRSWCKDFLCFTNSAFVHARNGL